MSRIIYADNNATTAVAPEVLEAMLPFFRERYGNPSSMHSFGGDVKRNIENAREQVAALLGAEPSEIVFTGCGTESDNAALRGALSAHPEKKCLVVSQVEHPAILNTCQALEPKGVEIRKINVNSEGGLNLDELRSSLDDGVALASIMWANNETGVIFPIQQIAEIVKSKGFSFIRTLCRPRAKCRST